MTTQTVKNSQALSGGIGLKANVKKTNGTTTPSIVDSKERRTKVNEATKEETSKSETAVTPAGEIKPVVPELTLEEKIAKVENLAVLIDKREKLQESRKKLTAFTIGSHSFSENIVLTDSEGNTFKTSNTEVFGSVVNVIRETLDTKIREIETKINF